MSAKHKSQFDDLPECPGCFAARQLTKTGLCETCNRLKKTGRLRDQTVEIETVDALPSKPTWQPLVRRTARGAIQTWHVDVVREADDTATIVTSFGLQGGAIQVTKDRILTGKNLGRKNATTPYTQAVSEAASLWAEKRDRNCYGLTIEESDYKKRRAPMLAYSWFNKKRQLTGHAKKVNWAPGANIFGQPKYDGNRCTLLVENGVTTLTSREGVVIDTCDHLVDVVTRSGLKSFTLDGELYAHGVPVTTIRSWIATKQPDTPRLCFVTYDANMEAPFVERFQHAINIAATLGGNFQVTRTVRLASVAELMAFHDECVAHGYEGAMLRHGDDFYDAGDRSSQLLKVKNFIDAEFVITGCRSGRGKFADAAVFECATIEGYKFDVTAPGSIADKEQYLANIDQYIGRKVVVKFQTLTATAQPVPFQPVAKEVL